MKKTKKSKQLKPKKSFEKSMQERLESLGYRNYIGEPINLIEGDVYTIEANQTLHMIYERGELKIFQFKMG